VARLRSTAEPAGLIVDQPPELCYTGSAMVSLQWQRRARIALILLSAAAVAAPARAQSAQLSNDDVLTLIATSDGHFIAGQKELEQGHVEAAKAEFNLAVDLLLESSYGGRTEPRIRDHFDRLVDRISTYEVRALATGDGFTEKKYEPASIDELLGGARAEGRGAVRPGEPRHPHPAESAGVVVYRAIPGSSP
jgi:hypothetical protein